MAGLVVGSITVPHFRFDWLLVVPRFVALLMVPGFVLLFRKVVGRVVGLLVGVETGQLVRSLQVRPVSFVFIITLRGNVAGVLGWGCLVTRIRLIGVHAASTVIADLLVVAQVPLAEVPEGSSVPSAV